MDAPPPLPWSLYAALCLLVSVDLLAIALYIRTGTFVRTALLAVLLVPPVMAVIRWRRYRVELLLQMLIVAAAVLFGLIWRPVGALVNLAYPVVFGVMLYLAARYDPTPRQSLLFAVGYLVLSALVDGAIAWSAVPPETVDYYLARGFSVDDRAVLPGIANRRFFGGGEWHRFAGAALDPLAHGMILCAMLMELWCRRTVPTLWLFAGAAGVFALTESRSAMVFLLVMFAVRQVVARAERPRRVMTGAVPVGMAAYVVFLMAGRVSSLAQSQDMHVAGVLFRDLDWPTLLGTGPGWITPETFENGVVFLLSGMGIFAVPLLALWARRLLWGIHRVRYGAFAAVFVLLPVHYYLFNVKTLAAFLLLFGSFRSPSRLPGHPAA